MSMSDIRRLQPVTIISEIFTPTPSVREGIKRFLDSDLPDEMILLRANRHRVVDREEYHDHVHDRSLALAQRALYACGSAPLQITGRVGMGSRRDGSTRLVFEVDDKVRFSAITRSIDHIPTLEEYDPKRSVLYFDVARNGLASDPEQLEEARAKMLSRGRHPSARRTLAVSTARIVTRDVPAYYLRPRESIRSDDQATQ